MFHKICFICFLLIFVFLYLYVKVETFATTQLNTIQPISIQLTSEISRVLSLSTRRIMNLTYAGDFSKGMLSVSFIILEPNLVEYAKSEMNANDAAKLTNDLINSGSFKVNINGMSVVLNKINNTTSSAISIDTYFNNTGLNDIAKYASDKYVSVPNDASLTKFFTLGFDNDYNIIPKMN